MLISLMAFDLMAVCNTMDARAHVDIYVQLGNRLSHCMWRGAGNDASFSLIRSGRIARDYTTVYKYLLVYLKSVSGELSSKSVSSTMRQRHIIQQPIHFETHFVDSLAHHSICVSFQFCRRESSRATQIAIIPR